jgi:flagellar basal-body rod modification protein FlgD
MSIQGVTSTDPTTAAVDPMAAAAASLPANDGMGRDVFLQLLVTQLKNQDPLAPQDNSAFLAQLAQFSSLEQLQTISQNTTTLVGALGGAVAAPPTTTTPKQGSN